MSKLARMYSHESHLRLQSDKRADTVQEELNNANTMVIYVCVCVCVRVYMCIVNAIVMYVCVYVYECVCMYMNRKTR